MPQLIDFGATRRALRLIFLLSMCALPSAADAWGNEGHKVIATIARGYLTPAVRSRVDALLAADTDSLTPHDMASAATWADAWRSAGHRETAAWHFVDNEIAHDDLAGACFGFPGPAHPASAGPAQDCVVNRIQAFTAELADPATPQPEKILALKYVLHFVGDLHQPLHASDNRDRGGNCVLLSLGGPRTVNLHSYWDTATVEAIGADPATVATKLRARITPAQKSAWAQGGPKAWAHEAYAVAKTSVYTLGSPAGCPTSPAPVALPPGYDADAAKVAAMQLQRAGVRLAVVLNRALGS